MGVADIDERRLDAADTLHIQNVARITSREQRAGSAPRRAGEIERDLCAGARDTRDRIVSLVDRQTIPYGDFDAQDLVEIRGEDANRGYRLVRPNQPFFDRVVSDGRTDISAKT